MASTASTHGHGPMEAIFLKLTLSCSKLKKLRMMRDNDPFVIAFVRRNVDGKPKWREVGRSGHQSREANPTFHDFLALRINAATVPDGWQLKLEVHDHEEGGGATKRIGKAKVDVGELARKGAVEGELAKKAGSFRVAVQQRTSAGFPADDGRTVEAQDSRYRFTTVATAAATADGTMRVPLHGDGCWMLGGDGAVLTLSKPTGRVEVHDAAGKEALAPEKWQANFDFAAWLDFPSPHSPLGGCLLAYRSPAVDSVAPTGRLWLGTYAHNAEHASLRWPTRYNSDAWEPIVPIAVGYDPDSRMPFVAVLLAGGVRDFVLFHHFSGEAVLASKGYVPLTE